MRSARSAPGALRNTAGAPPQPRTGVLRPSVVPDFKVQTRGLEGPAFSGAGDRLRLMDVLPRDDQPFRDMPIDGKIAVSVVNDNHFAVSPEPIAEDHTTVEDRVAPLTDRSRDID